MKPSRGLFLLLLIFLAEALLLSSQPARAESIPAASPQGSYEGSLWLFVKSDTTIYDFTTTITWSTQYRIYLAFSPDKKTNSIWLWKGKDVRVTIFQKSNYKDGNGGECVISLSAVGTGPADTPLSEDYNSQSKTFTVPYLMPDPPSWTDVQKRVDGECEGWGGGSLIDGLDTHVAKSITQMKISAEQVSANSLAGSCTLPGFFGGSSTEVDCHWRAIRIPAKEPEWRREK